VVFTVVAVEYMQFPAVFVAHSPPFTSCLQSMTVLWNLRTGNRVNRSWETECLLETGPQYRQPHQQPYADNSCDKISTLCGKDLMLEKQRDFWPGRAHRKTDIKWDEIL
jgi:hypothetical protein